MNFTIRWGTQTDVEALLHLIKELAVFEKEPEAVIITTNDLIEHGFGKNPKFKFFVAEDTDGIFGIALFYERYSTWKGPTIHLEDLIVTNDKRKVGAGKALYKKVIEYAHQHNFKRVAWEVLDWNINAINFYKSTGANYLNDWSVVQMNEEGMKKFLNN